MTAAVKRRLRGQTGLIWLSHGRPVIALTQTAATILAPSGASLTYRRKPAPPLSDGIDDKADRQEPLVVLRMSKGTA